MKIIRPLLIPFLLLLPLLFSCHGNNGSNSRNDSLNKMFADDTVPQDSASGAAEATDIVYDSADGYALAGKIPASVFSPGNYSIPFGFSPDSVLVDFFPGKIYHRPDSKNIFSCWSCDAYKSNRRRTYMDGELNFPLLKNETEWLDTISWKQPDGDRYLAFFLQSTEPTEDGGGFCCGRFTPAWVGVAVFHAEKERWKLLAYDPAVEISGLFHRADPPEVCVTGMHSFLLLINDHDQGVGSPTWKLMSFCAVSGNRIVNVSDKMNWGVGNRMTDWTTTVIPADTSPGIYPALQLRSSGVLVRGESEEIGENLDVPEAKDALQSAETLQFTRTQRMEFTGGKYRIVKTEFAADTTWEPPAQK